MIIKVKFSKLPVWDDDYMSSQREYSFTTKCNELKEGCIVWNKKYHKFLHVTETILDVDSEYYTPSIDKYTKTKYSDESFKLAKLKDKGEWYNFNNETPFPVFE